MPDDGRIDNGGLTPESPEDADTDQAPPPRSAGRTRPAPPRGRRRWTRRVSDGLLVLAGVDGTDPDLDTRSRKTYEQFGAAVVVSAVVIFGGMLAFSGTFGVAWQARITFAAAVAVVIAVVERGVVMQRRHLVFTLTLRAVMIAASSMLAADSIVLFVFHEPAVEMHERLADRETLARQEEITRQVRRVQVVDLSLEVAALMKRPPGEQQLDRLSQAIARLAQDLVVARAEREDIEAEVACHRKAGGCPEVRDASGTVVRPAIVGGEDELYRAALRRLVPARHAEHAAVAAFREKSKPIRRTHYDRLVGDIVRPRVAAENARLRADTNPAAMTRALYEYVRKEEGAAAFAVIAVLVLLVGGETQPLLWKAFSGTTDYELDQLRQVEDETRRKKLERDKEAADQEAEATEHIARRDRDVAIVRARMAAESDDAETDAEQRSGINDARRKVARGLSETLAEPLLAQARDAAKEEAAAQAPMFVRRLIAEMWGTSDVTDTMDAGVGADGVKRLRAGVVLGRRFELFGEADESREGWYRSRAVDRNSGKTVWLKAVREESPEAAAMDHERDAQAVTRGSEYILPIDVWRDGGWVYSTAPYAERGDLRDWMLHNARTLGDCLAIFSDILCALRDVHDFLVHLDVKPGNLVVTEVVDEADPSRTVLRIKLIDWDRSRVPRKDADPTLVTAGTPYYVASEQLLHKNDRGPMSDIFAAAAVLYELLNGRRPFAEAYWAWERQHAEDGYCHPLERWAEFLQWCEETKTEPDPGPMNDAVPPQVARLVRRLLGWAWQHRLGHGIAPAQLRMGSFAAATLLEEVQRLVEDVADQLSDIVFDPRGGDE